ncbi:MAG: chemotaxis protein CheW [Kofleriaceae bacterium]|nr:chemotaxis protein CheW [Kofleriaceae bacterium]MCB9574833.1 chemotaxis protein CheW [Kofleriaceae bacterium]
MVEGSTGVASGSLRLVCFELRGQELALPIEDVRETLTLRPITRVFLSPPWLAGIFSLRGDIVPAVDLGVLLGLPRTVPGDDGRLVVVEHGARVVGILVERLRELRTVDADAVEAAPANLAPEVASLLAGVIATPTGTVRVLDGDALFSSQRLGALAREEGASP